VELEQELAASFSTPLLISFCVHFVAKKQKNPANPKAGGI
jgi:hypothetical protein